MSAREKDSNGWYEIRDNPLSKVGVFPYRGAMIDPSGEMGLEPEGVYNVYRSKTELSSPETVDSFRLLPWIDDHEILGSRDNMLTPPEEKGIDGVIGEDVYFSGDTLYGNIKLFSETLADKIDNGKPELSCAYRCQYKAKEGIFGDQKYQFEQTEIRGNHLASVNEGRMGPDVAVLDHLTFSVDCKDFKPMARKNSLRTLVQDSSIPQGTSAVLLKVVSALDSLTTTVDAMKAASGVGDEDDNDKKADDEYDDDKKGEDEDDDDKKGEDGDPDKDLGMDEDKDDDDKKTGSDAVDTLKRTVHALNTDLRKFKRTGARDFFREVEQKNKLYTAVSEFVGAFDHKDMSTRQLAAYACDKLDLTPTKGHEVAALEGYLSNRRPAAAFGADLAIGAGGAGKVNDFFHPPAS